MGESSLKLEFSRLHFLFLFYFLGETLETLHFSKKIETT